MSAADANGTYLDFLRWTLRQSTRELNEESIADMNDTDYAVSAFAINWRHLLAFAKRQALVCVYWEGIGQLGNMTINKPSDSDVMEWMGAVKLLKRRNAQADEKTAWVANNFNAEGFRACILKGQGAASLYPKRDMRISGDIDVWVKPVHAATAADGKLNNRELLQRQRRDVEDVIAYCRSVLPTASAVYHHISFRNAGPVPVEVHYRPSWLNSPFSNRRLQAWFEANADRQFMNKTPQGFCAPTDDFNIVFMLCHLFVHLLENGVGLRHIVDYYYLLSRYQSDGKEAALLRRLGLGPIAGAVMWILHEKLGLPSRKLIYKPDSTQGKILLGEMLSGGNFGQYDGRPLSGTYNNRTLHNVQRLVRDVRLFPYFPSEAFWEPWFRLRNYFWRLRHN